MSPCVPTLLESDQLILMDMLKPWEIKSLTEGLTFSISSENIYWVFNAVLDTGNTVIIEIELFLKLLIDFLLAYVKNFTHVCLAVVEFLWVFFSFQQWLRPDNREMEWKPWVTCCVLGRRLSSSNACCGSMTTGVQGFYKLGVAVWEGGDREAKELERSRTFKKNLQLPLC